MKKIFHFTLMFSFLLIASQTMAQDGATTNGPVWRITCIKIKSGKGDDYTKWMREYRTRILAEQKSASLILDYKSFSKPTGDNSSAYWDLATAVLYRNYSEALDDNPERGRKMREIAIKVFGSRENQIKLQKELRDTNSDFVASHLVRELAYNPVKPASSGN